MMEDIYVSLNTLVKVVLWIIAAVLGVFAFVHGGVQWAFASLFCGMVAGILTMRGMIMPRFRHERNAYELGRASARSEIRILRRD